MKPAQKPFVVEFKNRRRVPRKDTSIWARVDLKAAGGETAGGDPASKAAKAHPHEAAAVQKEREITA